MKISYTFEQQPEEFKAEVESISENLKTVCNTVLSISEKFMSFVSAEKQASKADMLKYELESKIDQAINKVEAAFRNNNNNSNINNYSKR